MDYEQKLELAKFKCKVDKMAATNLITKTEKLEKEFFELRDNRDFAKLGQLYPYLEMITNVLKTRMLLN